MQSEFDLNFWKDKRVVITGNTGFKGGWLSLMLKFLGAKVYGISEAEVNTWNWGEEIKDFCLEQGFRADINSLAELTRLLRLINPHVVFHLAAQPLVGISYEKPVETFQTNVIGTVNLLEGCRTLADCQVVTVITTDKVYKNQERLTGYQETDALGGHDPYSASKACAEIVVESYRSSFLADKIALLSVRAGNVFGGGDFTNGRLMPDLVHAAHGKQKIEIRNLKAIRPWLYVLEPLWGYIQISEIAYNDLSYASSFNFGPQADQKITVKEFVSMFSKSWGTSMEMLMEGAPTYHETHCLLLDSTRINEYTGWRQLLDIEQSIQWSVDWYKCFFQKDRQQLLSFSCEQIKQYMELIPNLKIKIGN